MATAIELYRKAYNLDYRQGDWQQAEQLYKEIAEKYPYSDEKEYALVHLERIEKLRANPRDQQLQPVRGGDGGGGPFAVVNFVLVLLVAVGVGLNGWLWWQSREKHRYQDTVIQGMLLERIQNDAGAADLYKRAQEILPSEPLAYQFLAELYLSHRQFKLADIEARKWQIADPGSREAGDFRIRLKNSQQRTEPKDDTEQG